MTEAEQGLQLDGLDHAIIERLRHNGRIPFREVANELAVSEGSDAKGIPVHSTRMILVDRRGAIRGYYDAAEPDEESEYLLHVQRFAVRQKWQDQMDDGRCQGKDQDVFHPAVELFLEISVLAGATLVVFELIL